LSAPFNLPPVACCLPQLKQSAEQEVLEQCSFKPKTGRGPQHAAAHQGLPVAERLYHTARERQAKLERKAAEAEASSTQVGIQAACVAEHHSA
jgi:hypothetical protein